MNLMNNKSTNDNWNAIKAMIHRRWDEISDDEIEATQRNKSAVIDLLADKYQLDRMEAASRFDTALAEEKQNFQGVEEIRKAEIRFETDGGRVVPSFDDLYGEPKNTNAESETRH